MPAKKKLEPTPERGADVHRMMTDLDMVATCYLPSQVFRYPADNYSAPRDLVGRDGKTVIIWRSKSDGAYDCDGWEPWHDGMHGGRRVSLGSALNWVRVARGVRAGTIKDFTGA